MDDIGDIDHIAVKFIDNNNDDSRSLSVDLDDQLDSEKSLLYKYYLLGRVGNFDVPFDHDQNVNENQNVDENAKEEDENVKDEDENVKEEDENVKEKDENVKEKDENVKEEDENEKIDVSYFDSILTKKQLHALKHRKNRNMTVIQKQQFSKNWKNNVKNAEDYFVHHHHHHEMIQSSNLELTKQLALNQVTTKDLDAAIIDEQASEISVATAEEKQTIGASFNLKSGIGRNDNKSDDVSLDCRIERAAEYVQNAIKGKKTVIRGKKNRFFYHLRSSFGYHLIMYFFILLHFGLVFGESSENRETVSILLYIEIVCCVWHWLDFLVRLFSSTSTSATSNSYSNFKLSYFFCKFWNIVYFVVIISVSCDSVIALVVVNSLRWSRVLRPIILIARTGQLRRIISHSLQTLIQLQDLAFLLLIVMLMYGVIGVQLFHGTYGDNSANFENLPNALLSLFVLLTTESYPDVVNRNSSPWYLIYFITFILFSVYLLMSVMIACVLDIFKKMRRKQMIKSRMKERLSLSIAFKLLLPEGAQDIDYYVWHSLLKKLKPGIEDKGLRILFKAIDQDNNERINIIEFLELCDVLLLRFCEEKKRRHHDIIDQDPEETKGEKGKEAEKEAEKKKEKEDGNFSWRLRLSLSCEKICCSISFHYFVKFIVLLNSLISCLFGGSNSQYNFLLYLISLVLLVLMVAEMTICLIGYGVRDFFSDSWRLFDFIIVTITFCGQLLLFILSSDALVLGSADAESSGVEVFATYLKALLGLRILRLISAFKSTRIISSVVKKMFPLMGVVFALLICIFYTYAVIGMEIFATKYIPQLNEPGFSMIGFEDFWTAFLTLFQQLTTSNWHDVMYGAMDATSAEAAIYFVTFNTVVVVVILNVLIALIIDTFVLQREAKRTDEDILLQIPNYSGEKKRTGSLWRVWREISLRMRAKTSDVPEISMMQMQDINKHVSQDIASLKQV